MMPMTRRATHSRETQTTLVRLFRSIKSHNWSRRSRKRPQTCRTRIRRSPYVKSLNLITFDTFSETDRLISHHNTQYWFQRQKQYLFDRPYGAGQTGYCSAAASVAAVQHRTTVSTLTMCPLAFGAVNSGFRPNSPPAVNIQRRRPCAGNLHPLPWANVPAAASKPPPGLQNLIQCLPTATTLLHELFHMVLGSNSGVTYPPYGEIYKLFQGSFHMVGLDYGTALTNPESFAAAAVAYDYSLNSGTDAHGNMIEFFTGYTTQG
jgi:hypothetical protein